MFLSVSILYPIPPLCCRPHAWIVFFTLLTATAAAFGLNSKKCLLVVVGGEMYVRARVRVFVFIFSMFNQTPGYFSLKVEKTGQKFAK